MASNPYGRLLQVMKGQAEGVGSAVPKFEIGTVESGKKIKIGSIVLDEDDYSLIQITVSIGGKTFRVPSFEDQEITVGYIAHTIKFPKLKEGDEVALYRISDERYLVFGPVKEVE
jgi:hypothetical protein